MAPVGWVEGAIYWAGEERSSITPGDTQCTCTRSPGLDPARSSQWPVSRIFGLMRPRQRSPSASICKVRCSGLGFMVKAKRAGQFSAANKAIEMLGTYMGDMFGKNPKSPVDPAAVAALKSPREAASALLALAEKMDQQEQEPVPVHTPAKEEKDVSGTKRARKNQEDDREA